MYLSLVGVFLCARNISTDPSSDVLRRRFQINTMSGMGYQYKGIFDAVRVIVAQEGIRGMYKGIVPNLLKVAPSMASSWLSFEMTRDFLLSLRADAEDL
jgi:solute carrier family 25 phosphate transporter 23/24/25/41